MIPKAGDKVFNGNSQQPKKFQMLKSQMKALLITFFDIKGIVLFEFISQAKQSTKLNMRKYRGVSESVWTELIIK